MGIFLRNFASVPLHFLLPRHALVPAAFRVPYQSLHSLWAKQAEIQSGESLRFLFPLGVHLPVAVLNQPRCPLKNIVTSVSQCCHSTFIPWAQSAADTVFWIPAMNSAHRHSRQLKGLWLSSVSFCRAQFLFSSSSYACDTFSRNKHFFLLVIDQFPPSPSAFSVSWGKSPSSPLEGVIYCRRCSGPAWTPGIYF